MNPLRPTSKIKIKARPALGVPATGDGHTDQWLQNARERIERLEDEDTAGQLKTLRAQVIDAGAPGATPLQWVFIGFLPPTDHPAIGFQPVSGSPDLFLMLVND